MANFTAPLPPSRTTGDAPSGGPAADVNLLAAAMSEARGIIKTPAEIAASSDLSGTYQQRKLLTSDRPYTEVYGTNTSARYTNRATAIGFDPVDQVVFFIDQTGLYVTTFADRAATLSANKDFPLSGSGQTNPAFQMRRIIRFKGNLYCLTRDQANGYAALYKAAPAGSGNTAYAWSLVKTLTPGSTAFYGCLAADDQYLYVGDYGDPVVSGTKSTKMWRTADGTTFEQVWTAPTTVRHLHHIEPDPYNPGHVYATYGDGVSPCMIRSTDYGATWATVAAVTSDWQSVQISFDATRVYLAPDATYAPLFVMPRDLSTIAVGAHGDHRRLGLGFDEGVHRRGRTTSGSATFNDYTDVPFKAEDVGCRITGAGIPVGTTITVYTSVDTVTLSANATATASSAAPMTYKLHRSEKPMSEAFAGVVDPATGIYYGLACGRSLDDISGFGGSRAALFYIPTLGAPPVLLDVPPGDGNYSPRGVFIAGGVLYYGFGNRPLLKVAA